MRNLGSVAAAVILLISLNGCIGGAAAVALGTTGTVVSIAKDVFDIDVSIHSLFGKKQAEPISPTQVVLQPQLIVTGK